MKYILLVFVFLVQSAFAGGLVIFTNLTSDAVSFDSDVGLVVVPPKSSITIDTPDMDLTYCGITSFNGDVSGADGFVMPLDSTRCFQFYAYYTPENALAIDSASTARATNGDVLWGYAMKAFLSGFGMVVVPLSLWALIRAVRKGINAGVST